MVIPRLIKKVHAEKNGGVSYPIRCKENIRQKMEGKKISAWLTRLGNMHACELTSACHTWAPRCAAAAALISYAVPCLRV